VTGTLVAPHVTPVATTKVDVRLEQVSKTFPGTSALRGVTLDLHAGRVRALCGGNGSGKSTLIKILAGVLRADDGGAIEVRQEPHDVADWNPVRSFDAGLRFVHQDLGLFDELTVAENIALGARFGGTRHGRIDWRLVRAQAEHALRSVHATFGPDIVVRDLAPANRALVAIARALQGLDERRAVLVLDEPTEALPRGDADDLLASIRRFADSGHTVLYVSHRLDDVVRVADDIAVLRDGELVVDRMANGTTAFELTEMITGRAPADPVSRPSNDRGPKRPILTVDSLASGALRSASFELHRGEVLGVAGLVGAGADELLEVLFGARRPSSGTIEVDGEAVSWSHPGDAISSGFGYVAPNRTRDAAFAAQSVRDNITIASLRSYLRHGVLRPQLEQSVADEQIRLHGIRCASEQAPFWSLSGGNQQKAVLARWLLIAPRVLLLNEPTQGVDVGARADIYSMIHAATAAGSAVVLVSSDLDELASESDRVVVLVQGHATEVLSNQPDAGAIARSLYAQPGTSA
jgi:ribose transport system ATP-binding protein